MIQKRRAFIREYLYEDYRKCRGTDGTASAAGAAATGAADDTTDGADATATDGANATAAEYSTESEWRKHI